VQRLVVMYLAPRPLAARVARFIVAASSGALAVPALVRPRRAAGGARPAQYTHQSRRLPARAEI